MKRKKLQYFALLLPFMASLLLGGCGTTAAGDTAGSDSSADTAAVTYDDRFAEEVKARGYLIVGCKTDVPGLSFYDGETDTWSGLEIELAYKTAANLFGTDVESAREQNLVEFTGVTVADREEALENSEIDCMLATYTDTKEREERFSLSDSYYTDYIGIMVKTSGDNPNSLGSGEIKSLANLDGKLIGVARNSTTREDFMEYVNLMNTIKVSPRFMEYSSYEKLFAALKNEEIDAMSVDVSILSGYVDSGTKILNDRFAGQHYAAAVQKGHESLLPYINQAITE